MTKIDVMLAGLCALWFGYAGLVYIVLRELGWSRLRHRLGALFLILLSVAGLPGAGMLKIAWPHRKRVLALFITTKSPTIEWSTGCSMFPANNAWNTRVFSLPLDPSSERWQQSMFPERQLHADFAMPFNVIYGDHPKSIVNIDASGESDAGPYRLPDDAVVEDGSDSHLLVVDTGLCRLYELYGAKKLGSQEWTTGSAAIFDLRSNALRPETWTSADGAGLPILPGLVRYDEVKSGRIAHALRFTSPRTQRLYIWPARHFASHFNDADLPPMGARFRLKNSYDISGFSQDAQVILTALKEYGMILSDNGGAWFLTGVTDSRWSRALVRELMKVTGEDFEAVDVSKIMIDKDSAAAQQ